MRNKKISLKEAERIILSFLSNSEVSIDEKKLTKLTPDFLIQKASTNNFRVSKKAIKHWEEFEYGHIDWGEPEIFEILFEKSNYESWGNCILITDPCFSLKIVYQVPSSELWEFVQLEYVEVYNQDFVQPQDYILFFPEKDTITIIHHSGYSFLIEKEHMKLIHSK